MKPFLVILSFVLSFSAFAAFTEVECSGRDGVNNIVAAVEQGFPHQTIRRAYVRQEGPTGGQVRNFTVMSRGAFGNRVRYEGAGFQLEVDFWPDVRPQWARTYRGTFNSPDLNIPFSMVWCRFPNIRP
jgi:hypothetical protein